MKKYRYRDFDKNEKGTLSIYNKYVLVPLARLIALPFLNHTNVKPTDITVAGLLISFISAVLFWKGCFMLAAFVFQVSVIFDCVDGYIGRIKNNGSAQGILFDAYSDVVRVFINVLALAFHCIEHMSIVIWLMIFLFLNFCEYFIVLKNKEVEAFYDRQKNIIICKYERKIIAFKKILERYGIKTLFIYYHERIFLVLFLGPILNQVKSFAVIGVFATIILIHLRLIIDNLLIKERVLKKRTDGYAKTE